MSTLNKYDPVEENWKTLVVGKKGDKGDKGDQGDQGIQGEQGDQGDKGDQGDVGPMPTDAVTSTDINTIVILTQAAYDALDPADPDTLYIIEEV